MLGHHGLSVAPLSALENPVTVAVADVGEYVPYPPWIPWVLLPVGKNGVGRAGTARAFFRAPQVFATGMGRGRVPMGYAELAEWQIEQEDEALALGLFG